MGTNKKNADYFKLKFCPKVDVWAYLGLNVKVRLDQTIWGSSESSWDLENGKIMKKILRPKVDVWVYLGTNVESRLNHTLWGSFESSWAPET